MFSETVARPDAPSEPKRKRGFGASDAMALVAGAAIAISAGSKLVVTLVEEATSLCQIIMCYSSGFYMRGPERFRLDVAMTWSSVLWYGFQVLEVLVLSLSLTFLLMRLRPPRPPIRAMLRQPGTVAGLAVTFGYFWVKGWLHFIFFGRIIDECAVAVAVGGTVAVAWLFLGASRLWAAEPSWVDRMGRLIGGTAIAVALLALSQFGI